MIRQSIEHLFSLHHNIFKLFNDPARFQLMVSGQESMKLIFNLFLILNCYVIFNESMTHFLIRPPSIEEYLPLDEELESAPVVPERLYETLYSYRYVS